MEEATSDRESSESESKKNKQKTQGWIRMHTDEQVKPPSFDEHLDEESQPRDRKDRKELEQPQ
jgi:hypothetical protein